MLTREKIVALKARRVKLAKQRKRARRYLEQHGRGGVSDTLYKNEALIQEADAEIPIIDKELRRAWG